jgi:hypothetical protein
VRSAVTPSGEPFCGGKREAVALRGEDIVSENDRRFPRMTASQFLRKAWTAANKKARELGWII